MARSSQEEQDLLERALKELVASNLDDGSPVHLKSDEKKALAALLERVNFKASNTSNNFKMMARVGSMGGTFNHPEFVSPEDYVHRGKSMGTLDNWGDVMLSMKVKHLGLVWKDRVADSISREGSVAGSEGATPTRSAMGRGSVSSPPSVSVSVASSPVLEMNIKLIDSWANFDVFEVDRLCGGLPLQVGHSFTTDSDAIDN